MELERLLELGRRDAPPELIVDVLVELRERVGVLEVGEGSFAVPGEGVVADATGLRVEPYLRTVVVEWVWNSEFDPDAVCACGHVYYRHFDTYDQMRVVGCKYCGCGWWHVS